MKRGTLCGGSECFMFKDDNNRLKLYRPNTFNFKPNNHIHVDEIQRCIMDNMNILKRERKGYTLSNLNSLTEYSNIMNKNMPRPTNIMFDGSKSRIPMTSEEITYDKINYALNWAKIMNSCYFNYREMMRRI